MSIGQLVIAEMFLAIVWFGGFLVGRVSKDM